MKWTNKIFFWIISFFLFPFLCVNLNAQELEIPDLDRLSLKHAKAPLHHSMPLQKFSIQDQYFDLVIFDRV